MRVYKGNQTYSYDQQNVKGVNSKFAPYTFGLNAEDIVVNIWNIEHDDSWTVTLYQRGEKVADLVGYFTSGLRDKWAAYWIYQVYGAEFDITSCRHLYKGTLQYPDEAFEIRAEKKDGSRSSYVCTAQPTTGYDEFKNVKYDFDMVSK